MIPPRASSRLLAGSMLFAVLVLEAIGQRVYWNPESSTMGLGKTNELALVFEECSPRGEVVLPQIAGVEFGRPATSSQTSMINFRTTRRTILSYPVQPLNPGSFTIPTFSVETDRGAQVVSGVGFEVTDAAVGQTGLSIADVVESEIRLAANEVWVGQVIEVEYVLSASRRYQTSISGEPDWRPSDFLLEPFGEPERAEALVRGERRPSVRYRTRLVATRPGRFALDPVRQNVTVQTGERSTFFFSQPRLEQFVISSNRPALVVRELPSPAPPSFAGAVGSFSLDSKVVPLEVRVGEPVTWTLALRGTGNWTAGLRLPEREVSADFEVVQPRGREAIESGRLFSGSLEEDAVLVPTRAGTYTLGPVEFAYFDPGKGAYVNEVVAPAVLTILPPVSSGAGAAARAPGQPVAPVDSGGLVTGILPADLPPVPGVPRDPVPDGGDGMAPFRFSPAWWLFVAFVPPMLAWIGLAWREVFRGDSVRFRRAARRELLQVLAQAARQGSEPGRADLERWRELCIRMWQVPRAAPTADDMGAAIRRLRGATNPVVWVELWNECEAALYRSEGRVGSQWMARALHAARAARIHRSTPGFPHRWQHWAPVGAPLLALVAVVWAADVHGVEQAGDAYREGRFAEARAAWMRQVAAKPHDWSARNNVALTHAQESRWPDAAAHWMGAFLLNPRESSVQSNLRLALTHMDGIDPALRRMVGGTFAGRLTTVLSPGEWQRVFFGGAGLSAGGLTVVVLALYFGNRRGMRLAGSALCLAGVVTSAASVFAETLYGPLAQPGAGMVTQATQLYSIPTDLAEKQQMAPLPPGTIVVIQRSFLGWDHVITGDDVTGWLRREVITPFFKPPRPPLVAAPTTAI